VELRVSFVKTRSGKSKRRDTRTVHRDSLLRRSAIKRDKGASKWVRLRCRVKEPRKDTAADLWRLESVVREGVGALNPGGNRIMPSMTGNLRQVRTDQRRTRRLAMSIPDLPHQFSRSYDSALQPKKVELRLMHVAGMKLAGEQAA
jgi:hypothetical protein